MKIYSCYNSKIKPPQIQLWCEKNEKQVNKIKSIAVIIALGLLWASVLLTLI